MTSVTHQLIVTVPTDSTATAAGEVTPSSWNATHVLVGIRNAITANTVINVDPVNGNDSTGSLTSPFKTFTAAYQFAFHNIDFNAQNVTLQGTAGAAHTAPIVIGGPAFNSAGPVGAGTLIIDLGGGTLSVTTAADAIFAKTMQPFTVQPQNGTLNCTGTGGLIHAALYTGILFGPGLTFGNIGANGSHILAEDYSVIVNVNNYTVNSAGAGGVSHMATTTPFAWIFNFPTTVTISQAISLFAWAYTQAGNIWQSGTTFVNKANATCLKFWVSTSEGIINTSFSGINFFPGSSAGAGGQMGQYDGFVFVDDTASANFGPQLTNAANDAAAAAAGVPVGAMYRNGSVIMLRVT